MHLLVNCSSRIAIIGLKIIQTRLIMKPLHSIFLKRVVSFRENLYVEYLDGSPPYIPYEVQVSVQNIIGEGPRSELTIVYSAEGSKLFLRFH